MRLSTAGELALLRELERRGLVASLDSEGAVLPGGRVVTQDALVEGVHFRREWTGWGDLGYKAAAVNLSDLAALGAEPEGLLLSLVLPAETEIEAVVELYEGVAETGARVLGGDTTAGSVLALAVTALGLSERVPGRAGARPGDVLTVTGPLGAAAAGLYALEHGLEGHEELVRAHLRPPFRLEAGRELARVAHALVDISDGLAADAARIAERSGVRVVLEPEAVPRAAGIEEVADLPFWSFGEDYELLAALAPADAEHRGLVVVGRVEEGAGVDPPGLPGWDSLRDS